jgi:protein involved in polysaccharide export with SLBB domain
MISRHSPGSFFEALDPQKLIKEDIPMLLLRAFVLITLVFCLMACAPNTVINPEPISKFQQPSRPTPQTDYLIGVGDTLDIKFMYNPELNELLVPVRPDGRISLQLANDIQAAGLTPEQLRKNLIEKYSAEIKKPEIGVIVRTFTSNKVFVDGEVLFPGTIDIRGPMTLFEAIAQTRGMRETARLSNIIVIRKDSEGKPMSTNIDYRRIIDGTDLSQNIYLMPYDIVYVPKSTIANLNKFVNEYINQLIPNRFPEFSNFYNPYTFAFGGYYKAQGLSQ